jgi:phage-related protein
MIRTITFYQDHFTDFFSEQPKKVQDKILYVFRMVENVEKVPEKFLKHLTGTDGLYEMRVEVGNNIYRIFCFFDAGKLVIVLNGFQKKTQKTPSGEIEKAERLKKEYFLNKK